VRAPYYLSEELLFKVKKRIKWPEKKKAFSCGKGENGNKIFETDLTKQSISFGIQKIPKPKAEARTWCI